MAAIVVSSSGFGQTVGDFISESVKLTASDGESEDFFGYRVSISGERVVIGAFEDDDNGDFSGSAYIFERDGAGSWTEVQKLTPSDGEEHDSFGISVSISGDTVVVGASYGNDNVNTTGSAYIFERGGAGTWTEVQKLTPSDGAAYDYFGYSVSITGDRVVVGAVETNNNGITSGSAYIFERDVTGTWVEVQKLTPSDGAESDLFGISVSISGDTVVAGATLSSGNGAYSGSAYIFERDVTGTWVEVQKLTPSDGELYDLFGISVSISGERVVIGAKEDDDNGDDSGSAYIFERDGNGTWTEVQKLTPSDGSAEDYFGYSVSISGDRVVVGAYHDNDNGYSGSAYIFEVDGAGTWTEVQKLTPSDGAAYDSFGCNVSIAGDSVVIGAFEDNDNGADSGSAYMFACNRVLNLIPNDNRGYLTLEEALTEVIWGDRLAVRSSAFAVEDIINTSSIPLTFIAVEPIVIGAGLMFLPADGTNFVNSGDVDAAGYSLAGKIFAPSAGTLIFSDLDVVAEGQFKQNDADLLLNDALTTSAGDVYMLGEVFCEMVETGVSGVNRVAGDTRIYADYTNAGATIIQEGILYIYGDLVNTGTLSGEYNNGFAGGSAPDPGDGFNIGGSYTIGPNATLSMPNPVWWLRVGGDLDIAIDDPSQFVMSQATIELNGLAPGTFQTFETLSADFGPDEAGFDPSNFPIGTLRITSHSSTHLVNNHDNTVAAPCEVLYVDELLVSAGATLQTNGCPIYARSATIDGTVDDPGNIILVQDDCFGDIDGNGIVNGADLAALLGAWGTTDPSTDLNGDGDIDGADLAVLLGAWGVCP